MSLYGLDESSALMKNLDTNLRLCGFAAIVATILISSSARAVAQTNVQNAQVVGSPGASASPQASLPNFSAVSTPVDTPPPPSTSGAGLSALIAIPPQNSGSPATSASPATAVSPAVSTSPTLPVDAYTVRYQSNLKIDAAPITLPSPAPSPAVSASPATKNVPIQGSQVNEAAHIAAPGTYNFGASYSGDANNSGSPGSAPITPSKNVLIQGSQANDNAHAKGTGTITPSKNIPIQRAQVNNPPTGNADNAGDAGNGGFNQHPGRKNKNKGHGQLSNAGTAGDDDGRKLHTDGQGGGWPKKQQQMQTQGQVSQEGGQGDDGQRHRHPQKLPSTQSQPQQQGGGGGKGKPTPTPTPH